MLVKQPVKTFTLTFSINGVSSIGNGAGIAVRAVCLMASRSKRRFPSGMTTKKANALYTKCGIAREGAGELAGLPEVVVGLHGHPHCGGGVEGGFELEGHGGGDAGASVEEAGEGGAVHVEAGGEGGHFGVAHEFFGDFAEVCGVVRGHWVPSVSGYHGEACVEFALDWCRVW